MNIVNKKVFSDTEESQSLLPNYIKVHEKKIGCHQNCRDCSNVFKAFIGSAMIGMPFAVNQAGIALSLIGIFVIAVATDHCCNLIVRCKQIVIKNKIKELNLLSSPLSFQEEEKILNDTISYGSIAKSYLGVPGVLAVNISVLTTQFGFSIGYFIFLGNTLRSILKRYISTNNSLNKRLADPRNYSLLLSDSRNEKLGAGFVFQSMHFYKKRFSLLDLSSDSKASFARLLVIPVVFLILVSFIRSLRKLGPISLLANLSLIIAFVATASYLLGSLDHISSDIKYFKLSTFPIFFGQLTGAFEGIGAVIPIEGSMGYNRIRYPKFLHCSLFSVSVILASFGIIGYISFGDKICQIATANLNGLMATILQILLFFGVLLTYPLQIYPCIEIMETLLIKYRKWHHRVFRQQLFRENKISYEKELRSKECVLIWEGNLIRIALVSMTAIIGLIFREQFAYIAAFNGAVGSSLLVYILPPMIHQ
ncbi:proton-coupled amino acid transporter 1-like isoform X1 [Hydra vulgaris]|uniref:Proton-coupled amino acid transporter 1-like isoform X1 n=2 Tax=Hydra vulgaris TaxID=6087 RepID=A0ABM4CCQ8_HYDVU